MQEYIPLKLYARKANQPLMGIVLGANEFFPILSDVYFWEACTENKKNNISCRNKYWSFFQYDV